MTITGTSGSSDRNHYLVAYGERSGVAELHHQRVAYVADGQARRKRNQHDHHHQSEQFQFSHYVDRDWLAQRRDCGILTQPRNSARERQRHLNPDA